MRVPPRVIATFGLVNLLLIAASAAATAAPGCNGDVSLGQALVATIEAKAKFAREPARYCQMERKQLRLAQTYFDWIAGHRDCFGAGKLEHLLRTVGGLVATARKDVAKDCR